MNELIGKALKAKHNEEGCVLLAKAAVTVAEALAKRNPLVGAVWFVSKAEASNEALVERLARRALEDAAFFDRLKRTVSFLADANTLHGVAEKILGLGGLLR